MFFPLKIQGKMIHWKFTFNLIINFQNLKKYYLNKVFFYKIKYINIYIFFFLRITVNFSGHTGTLGAQKTIEIINKINIITEIFIF
jgi:hypothetical protein